MDEIEFLEQVAMKQIRNAEYTNIEYDRNSIIIIDTFINELYDKLYDANGGDHQAIMDLIKSKKIMPFYDRKIFYLKIRLLKILNKENYNLSVLTDELRINYSWIVNQMLGELKRIKAEKNN